MIRDLKDCVEVKRGGRKKKEQTVRLAQILFQCRQFSADLKGESRLSGVVPLCGWING